MEFFEITVKFLIAKRNGIRLFQDSFFFDILFAPHHTGKQGARS